MVNCNFPTLTGWATERGSKRDQTNHSSHTRKDKEKEKEKEKEKQSNWDASEYPTQYSKPQVNSQTGSA
jgi:hypothetical protein